MQSVTGFVELAGQIFGRLLGVVNGYADHCIRSDLIVVVDAKWIRLVEKHFEQLDADLSKFTD